MATFSNSVLIAVNHSFGSSRKIGAVSHFLIHEIFFFLKKKAIPFLFVVFFFFTNVIDSYSLFACSFFAYSSFASVALKLFLDFFSNVQFFIDFRTGSIKASYSSFEIIICVFSFMSYIYSLHRYQKFCFQHFWKLLLSVNFYGCISS